MAARQNDAIEFGRMYQQALAKTGAPVEAQGMMNSQSRNGEAAGRIEIRLQRVRRFRRRSPLWRISTRWWDSCRS